MTPGFVWLNEDSAFYGVFPEGKAPVKDTAPVAVALVGDPEKEAYMLDIEKLTSAQVNKIALICAGIFGGVAEATKQQMTTIGFPIRKSQTSGVVS